MRVPVGLLGVFLVLASGCTSDPDVPAPGDGGANDAPKGDAPLGDAGVDAGPRADEAPPLPNGPRFYVSPSGDDQAGDGSKAKPWKTLFKATSTVTTPKATIELLPGTYVESQTSTLAVGVNLIGAGDSSVVRSTLTARFKAVLELTSPEGTDGDQQILNLKFDGTSLATSVGVVVAGRSNVSMHHCTVVDFRDVGVNFSGIQSWTGPVAPTTYATGNKFYRNVVKNSSIYDGYGTGCVQFGGQRGFVMHDNDVAQPSRGKGGQGVGWPVKMANEGHVIDCKIYDNTLTKAPFTGAYGGDQGFNFAVEFWNVEGMEVMRNTIQGAIDFANVKKSSTSKHGLHFHDNTVQETTLQSGYEDGLFLETDELDVLIESNTFRNLSSGVAFAPHDYTSNGVGIDVHRITIQKNLFEGIGFKGGGQGAAVRWHNTDFNPETKVSDVAFFANTVVAAPGADAALVGIGLPGYQGPTHSSQISVIDNIVRGFSYATLTGQFAMSNVVVKNNLFFQNGSGDDPVFSVAPSPYTTANNIKADPKFTTGFALLPASPAVNAGIDVGLPFLGTAPDLGAFESF